MRSVTPLPVLWTTHAGGYKAAKPLFFSFELLHQPGTTWFCPIRAVCEGDSCDHEDFERGKLHVLDASDRRLCMQAWGRRHFWNCSGWFTTGALVRATLNSYTCMHILA